MLKKILYFGLVAAFMASCTNSKPIPISYGATENVHIVDPNGNISTSKAMVNMLYEYSESVGELSVGNLKLGNESVSVTCNQVKADLLTTTMGEVFLWKPTSVTNSNITDFGNAYTLFCSRLFVYPSPFPGILNSAVTRFIFAGFTANGYTVKTFPEQTYYAGKFEANMPGIITAFTSEDPYIAVNMDLSNMKASVVIYDAQFASGMPKIHMFIDGLDIILTTKGYQITGSNVIPSQLEGGNKTPNPKYTISEFNFSNQSTDLTVITLDFTLANGAEAHFKGANTPVSL